MASQVFEIINENKTNVIEVNTYISYKRNITIYFNDIENDISPPFEIKYDNIEVKPIILDNKFVYNIIKYSNNYMKITSEFIINKLYITSTPRTMEAYASIFYNVLPSINKISLSNIHGKEKSNYIKMSNFFGDFMLIIPKEQYDKIPILIEIFLLDKKIYEFNSKYFKVLNDNICFKNYVSIKFTELNYICSSMWNFSLKINFESKNDHIFLYYIARETYINNAIDNKSNILCKKTNNLFNIDTSKFIRCITNLSNIFMYFNWLCETYIPMDVWKIIYQFIDKDENFILIIKKIYSNLEDDLKQNIGKKICNIEYFTVRCSTSKGLNYISFND